MADIIDIAQQRQLEQVQIQPKDYSKPSLTECEECGNDIPPERQKYGAVTLCVACQSNLELNGVYTDDAFCSAVHCFVCGGFAGFMDDAGLPVHSYAKHVETGICGG